MTDLSRANTVYAIDFGTSNSLLAAAQKGQAVEPVALDPGAESPEVMRSLVYFHPESGVSFASKAIEEYVANSMEGRFLKSMKRFLPVKSFESTLVNGKQRKLEDLIACFLREMRERANRIFEEDVTSVVLGRPARFSEDDELDALASKRLESAARLAGFVDIEFLAEPVAAAYRFQQELENEEVVLVADFGGGTSDYTVLKLSQKEFQPEDVLAVGGVPIAGDILDGQIMRHRVAENFGSEVRYKVPFGKNVMQMPKALVGHLCSTAYINLLNSRENRQLLSRIQEGSLHEEDARYIDQLEILLENQLGFAVFEAIEAAKREVSEKGLGSVTYEYPGIEISEQIKASQFEEYTQSELAKVFASLDETLLRAGVRPEEVDRVCCTGGTAKVSLVRKGLEKRFGVEKLEGFRNFTSIVEGLSQRAVQLSVG